VTQRYALNVKDALTLSIKRQWIFFLRNKAFIVFRLLQVRAAVAASLQLRHNTAWPVLKGPYAQELCCAFEGTLC
jgi:hypothetical protein